MAVSRVENSRGFRIMTKRNSEIRCYAEGVRPKMWIYRELVAKLIFVCP